MMSRACSVLAVGGAGLFLSSMALGQGVQVIHCKIAGNAKSVVPGATDLTGAAAVTEFRSLEDLVMSPGGSRWLLEGRTQLGADLENLWVMGSSRCGTKFLQEGDLAPGGGADERYDFFGSGLGRFNEADRFAFTARIRNMATGSTAAANGQRVLLWNGTAVSVLFAQNGLITGLSDTGAAGDEGFGNSVGSAHLLNNGTVGLQDSTITNIATSRRPAIMYNNVGFHQSNVTTVTDLVSMLPVTWSTIDANAFYTTPDNAHWMATGLLVGQVSLDNFILVRDGAVIMQTGTAIGMSGYVPQDLFDYTLLSNGDWVARGDNAGNDDWAVRNGTLIAKTGDPITTGSAENWGNTFTHITGDRRGNWIIMGNTSSADPAADHVAVLNGTTVLFREGDPVDLNDNGLFDDDAFIGRGNNTLSPWRATMGGLTDDGWLYCIVNLRNGAGADLNGLPVFSTPDAFVRIRAYVPCAGDFNRSGGISVQDIFDFLEAYFSNNPRADINDSCSITVQDIFDFLAAYFAGC